MSNAHSLYTLRERLVRLDKYLAKLYRWSKNINAKIDRVQRERVKLVERIEKEELRLGVDDGTTTEPRVIGVRAARTRRRA